MHVRAYLLYVTVYYATAQCCLGFGESTERYDCIMTRCCMDGCLALADEQLVWGLIWANARNDVSISDRFYITPSAGWPTGGGRGCVCNSILGGTKWCFFCLFVFNVLYLICLLLVSAHKAFSLCWFLSNCVAVFFFWPGISTRRFRA